MVDYTEGINKRYWQKIADGTIVNAGAELVTQ